MGYKNKRENKKVNKYKTNVRKRTHPFFIESNLILYGYSLHYAL